MVAALLSVGLVLLAALVVVTRRRPTIALPPITQAPPAPSCRACSRCGAILGKRSEAAHCPLDGGAIIEAPDPWPGRILDERLYVEELIGLGGMGRVYRARHERLGTKVALKLLNAELASDKSAVDRFAREARASMRIRSPHVVSVHDLGELPPGIPYLTMELIEGVSLSRLLSSGRRLTAPSVAMLGRQLAAGLAVAHAEHVLHRDLKPDNVLIARNADSDIAKIVDFGLSKIVDELGRDDADTTVGRVFGTPGYISPEQAVGQPAEARSDIYSLGVLLYRARAGRKPFEGSLLELLQNHVHSAPPPLGDSELDALIMSLLAKEPARRPEAAELVARFDALSNGVRRLIVDGRHRDPSLSEAATIPVEAAPAPATLSSEAPVGPPPSDPPNLCFADSELALVRCGQVFITVLRKPLTLGGVEHLRRESRELFGEDASRFFTLSVVGPISPKDISAEVRVASEKLTREFRLGGAAIVIEGSGFKQAATRAVIAAVFLVSRIGYRHRVFDKPLDAAEWLEAELAARGVRQSALEVIDAVEEGRRAVDSARDV
jgi:serine/threonine protein kinase